MKRLHVFTPGTYIADSGVAYTFSEAQLQATANAYDPAKHEAPLVVGHPKSDAPAYGWAKSLAFADGELNAEPHQVDPAFDEMVAAGRFKKRSASFYAPGAKNNPVPGVYYLRHIGFLGAQPPAVKGLKAVEFADAEDGVIDFADWNDMTNASLWRNLRDWFIEQFGKEKADNVLPDYSISQLATAAAQEPDAPATSAYSENPQGATMTPAEIAAREAALAATAAAQAKKDEEQRRRDAEFAERETRIVATETATATAAAAATRAEIVSFVEGLVAEGRVLPAHREAVVEVLAALPADAKIEFAEGDKKVTKPTAAWLRDYLKAQPKLVEFREAGAGDGSENDATDAQSIANRALEFQESEKKAGREISISAAVKHITQAAN